MRNIRPSWLAVRVDGKARVATGPRGRDGGTLDATFYVRELGAVLPLLDVECIAHDGGAFVDVRVIDKRTGKVLLAETFHQ